MKKIASGYREIGEASGGQAMGEVEVANQGYMQSLGGKNESEEGGSRSHEGEEKGLSSPLKTNKVVSSESENVKQVLFEETKGPSRRIEGNTQVVDAPKQSFLSPVSTCMQVEGVKEASEIQSVHGEKEEMGGRSRGVKEGKEKSLSEGAFPRNKKKGRHIIIRQLDKTNDKKEKYIRGPEAKKRGPEAMDIDEDLNGSKKLKMTTIEVASTTVSAEGGNEYNQASEILKFESKAGLADQSREAQ
jgi:hypothetical protein